MFLSMICLLSFDSKIEARRTRMHLMKTKFNIDLIEMQLVINRACADLRRVNLRAHDLCNFAWSRALVLSLSAHAGTFSNLWLTDNLLIGRILVATSSCKLLDAKMGDANDSYSVSYRFNSSEVTEPSYLLPLETQTPWWPDPERIVLIWIHLNVQITWFCIYVPTSFNWAHNERAHIVK